MEVILLKKNYFYLVLIITALVFTSCTNKDLPPQSAVQTPEKDKQEVQEVIEKEVVLNIVTTDKLKYFMIRDIVKDLHFVDYMFSSKNRLWSYEYSEDALKNINKKDLFFYSVSALEPWATQFVDKLDKGTVSPVNISRGIKFLSLSQGINYKETSIKDNPYFWMNIDNFKIAMLNIKNAIQDKDTKNRELYEENFNKAIKRIEEKHKRLEVVVAALKQYTFLVDGDELDYFTSYYGLKTVKIYNYSMEPTEENSAKLEESVKKLSEFDKLIYIYENEEEARVNKPISDKFKIKPCNLLVYKDEMSYLELLEHNITVLESLIEKQEVKNN
jgi:ABC-type Zn uptake system ZnuABC Zn-binding protein ZnuA